MSTKTTFKRIALVTVAALSFGLLSTSTPANAAAGTWTAVNSVMSATVTNSNLIHAGRVGVEIQIPITATGSAAAAVASKYHLLRFAAAITSQPATSAVYAKLTTTATSLLTGLNNASTTVVAVAPTTSAIGVMSAGSLTSTGAATGPASLMYQESGDQVGVDAASNTVVGTLNFVPTVAGTYSVTVWNESSSSGAASLSGSESSKTFTINVSTGVSSITLTRQNSSTAIAEGNHGRHGALIKVQLKDAAGNAAVLSPGEAVTLTPSGTGDIGFVNGGVVASDAGAAYNLSASNFNSSGIAWVNLLDATAGTTNLTAAIAGGANASTSITFVDAVAYTTAPALSATATGWAGTVPNVDIPIGTSTLSWRATASSGSAVQFSVNERLVAGLGNTGSITGYTVALAYDCVGISAGSVATCSVTATTTADEEAAYDISPDPAAAYTADSGTQSNAIAETNVPGALTVSPGTVNAVVGASTTFTVTLKDLFGRAYANQTLSGSVTGKNPTSTATLKVTDANGQATFSVTDANTNTAVSDTLSVSISGGSTATATIAYGTNTVGTVTLEYPGDADVVAGTTFTEISAAGAGATGTSATVTAVITGSTGALLAGVPVTFAVSGLTGAEVHTTLVTVYTDTSGEASTSISSYAAGKATVTATAGGKSSTADIYFKQTGTGEARTIAAAVSGNVVTATVKDRYGNTIEGVAVNATRSGTGYFGSGASTATGNTDKNGQIEFIFTGTGTVTVAFTSATFGQSADAAGKVGITAVTASAAGTTTTAQTGLGAALAPAGINSASVAVDSANEAAANATAAADAAAEATDAANAATDAANAAAEAADAATAAAQDAADAVAALSTSVTEMVNALKKQITSLTNLVIKIQKKVRA
jgi:hypothetical protein